MKIVEYSNHVLKNNGTPQGEWVDVPRKVNMDGPEIISWMRDLCKVKGLGLLEISKSIKPESSTAEAKFIDIQTLKNGFQVCVYVVKNNGGMYRNWIAVDSKKFSNDGHCTQLNALSKEKLMNSILNYKVGKMVAKDGQEAIQEYAKRYNEAAKRGTTGTHDVLGKYMYNEFGVDLGPDYTLEDVQETFRQYANVEGGYSNDDYAHLRSDADYRTF